MSSARVGGVCARELTVGHQLGSVRVTLVHSLDLKILATTLLSVSWRNPRSSHLINTHLEMHQYLDSDGSGTSPTCVSSTIGAERLQAATDWLKANNFKGFLGEIGAGSNGEPMIAFDCTTPSTQFMMDHTLPLDNCITALKGAFTLMQKSGTPWIGALWWAGTSTSALFR